MMTHFTESYLLPGVFGYQWFQIITVMSNGYWLWRLISLPIILFVQQPVILTNKIASKFWINGPLWGNNHWLVDSPHRRPVMWEAFPCQDITYIYMYIHIDWFFTNSQHDVNFEEIQKEMNGQLILMKFQYTKNGEFEPYQWNLFRTFLILTKYPLLKDHFNNICDSICVNTDHQLSHIEAEWCIYVSVN